MSKADPEQSADVSERVVQRTAPPGTAGANVKTYPDTAAQHVVERIIERDTDPQTGRVVERVVQTVPVGGAAPVASQPAAATGFDPNAPHAQTGDQDEVYYEGSPLLRGEFDQIFIYGAIGVILIMIPVFAPRIFHGTLPAWWHWWLTAGFVGAGIIVLLVPLIITKSVRYRVTNYRINWERGIFGKDIDTLELWHVEDVNFRQSFFQRLMGVGTIRILSHDDNNPTLLLRSVPNARYLFDTLQQRIIAVKRGPGVMKVDTGN